ncbi:PAS domain-containing protein [Nannocystis sp. SCPEA4]|uniref:GAF domain-containing sensor histidine kinase n=1 Tax=Nannocystis sp. SCPEA4 TaxID=2996787 RepID=UPI00226E482C|nr:PAS domain-containing protein [Nannocystis sp. SCPEA4]MCY1056528.1 PAS domain-containing protein [Nannocystis sp. SCPEA4]
MSLTARSPAIGLRVDGRVLRTHVEGPPSPAIVARLEHEWSLRDQLDPSATLRPLAIAREGGAVSLTFADPGGRLLADLPGAPWEVAAFLRVAIGLATALVRLHARGFAHTEIHAGHVLVKPSTGECWLTNLGAAVRLPTAADVRGDLHGCGVVLRELLAGFEPGAMATRALARVVARLVVARDGDAYTTAAHLLADLRRCAAAWAAKGRIDAALLEVGEDHGGAHGMFGERERAGAGAQHSVSELMALIDAVPGLVWSARGDGSIDFVSQGWSDYTGKSATELLGWAWASTELMHPADRAPMIEAWAGLLAAGKEGRMEARLRRADGAYRWFRIQAVPLLDDRGDVVKWWGLDSDIEEQKQSQVRAGGEQRLLEMITRGEPTSAILEGVVRLVEGDASGQRASILLLNPATMTLWHAAAVSLPRSYSEVIDGSPIGPAAFSCGTAAWRRELVVIADIATDPLGELFGAHALAHGLRACWSLPLLSSDGRVLGAFGIYATEPRTPTPSDLELLERCARVTSIAVERGQSEEALRRSEAYRAEAERLSRTGSFGFDLQSREFTLSNGTCEIMGLPPKPTFDQVHERIHRDDRDRVRATVLQALRAGGDFDDEVRVVMDDGAVKLIRVLGRSRINATGNFELVGAAADITAGRRAADELQQAQTALTHVSRVTTLGELAASIAHEVNQPLTAIVADASAALNWSAAEPPALERVRESLAAIVDHGERAAQVLQRIRSLLARSTPRHRACNLNDVVRDVVPLVAPELRRHEINVEQVLLRELPPVMGDPVQLQQVVLNLLLNAGEASKDMPPERRRVVIRSFVEQRQGGAFVRVAVEDAGVGLDTGILDRARLFDPFYTTKENGLGMGLPISRSIIERHGGKLWASANATFGATFQFAIEVQP